MASKHLLSKEILLKLLKLLKPDMTKLLKFKLPVELTIKIFSHLTIPSLHKELDLTLEQLLSYVRMTGFEKFKNQLMEIGVYKVMK